MRLAEVAPAAGPAIEALPFLLALAGLLVALGLIKFVTAFIDFIVWMIRKTVGHIPFAGGAIAGLAHRGAAKLTNALGKAEQGLDHYIGWCWHNTAVLARHFVREIEGLAHVTWLIAKFLAKHPSWAELKAFAHALVHPIRTFQHLERRLIRLYRAKVAAIEHTVGAAVLPRIHAGEAALDRVIEWDIPRLRARERAISRRLERLWKWSRAHAKPLATAAFVAAVAVALRRMGLGWIRCRNVKRFGRAICGLNAPAFDALLAGLVGALALADYRDLVRQMQDVEHAAAEELIDLLHAFE